MSLSLYLEFQPTERRRKMERGTKYPQAYFRWSFRGFSDFCSFRTYSDRCRAKKTITDFHKAFCNSQDLLPSVPATQTMYQHSMAAVKADLRDLCCSLLTLQLCMKIHIIKTNFFNSRIFTLVISSF